MLFVYILLVYVDFRVNILTVCTCCFVHNNWMLMMMMTLMMMITQKGKKQGVHLPPTAMTLPPPLPFPSLSLRFCPSPRLTGNRGHHPWGNFGIKEACRWVLEHFSHKHQLNFAPLTSLFPPPEDFSDVFLRRREVPLDASERKCDVPSTTNRTSGDQHWMPDGQQTGATRDNDLTTVTDAQAV